MLRICSVLIMSSCFEWGPWGNNGSVSYSILVENHGAHTLLGTFIHQFIAASVHLFMDKPEGDFVQLYIGWSLTLVFLSRLVEHTLCLEQLHGCLIQPLYICTRTNLRVTYSGQSRGWSESTLILTNDSTIARTRLICVDQSQGWKSAKR